MLIINSAKTSLVVSRIDEPHHPMISLRIRAGMSHYKEFPIFARKMASYETMLVLHGITRMLARMALNVENFRIPIGFIMSTISSIAL